MNGILNIGLQSLMVFQDALEVTSENMANVNTPNYSRRQIDLTENVFQGGVNIADVRRVYDQTADQNVYTTTSDLNSATTNLQRLQYFESVLDTKTSGVAGRINDSLKALVATDGQANNMLNRNNFLNQLKLLVTQFNDVNAQFNQEQNSISQTLTTDATDINDIMQSLSGINLQLATATADAQSNLLDQQAGLLTQLSQYINFTTQATTDGAINVFLPDGTSLLLGNVSYPLSTANDPADPSKLILNVTDNSANIRVDNVITSGSIAGLLAYRDQSVSQAANALGRLAMAMSQDLNNQNQLGIDLNGNLGGSIFNDINTTTLTAERAIANANNTGTEGANSLNVTINNTSTNNMNNLTTSDYSLSFSSPTQYTLMRQSDGTFIQGTLSGTFPQTIVSQDGFTINVTAGGYAKGDQFLISPTRGALDNFALTISDPKLFALASPVQGIPGTSNTGTATMAVQGAVNTANSSFSLLQASPPTYALNPPLKIVFTSSTAYSIINANTSAVIQSGIPYNASAGATLFPTPAPTSYDPGYRATLSGAVNAGDTFTLTYNTNLTDNTNGVAMENIYNNNNMQNGTLNFTAAYSLLSGNVSQQTSSAQNSYTSSKTLNDAAKYRQSQISGVSIQEESANLQLYQQSYQASSQILMTSKVLFEAIMGMLR